MIGIVAIIVTIGTGYYIVLASQSDGTPDITITPATYDWGTVDGNLAITEIAVRNDGDGDLVVRKIATSCGCTTARLATADGTTPPMGMDHGNLPPVRAHIKPGEEATLTVQFDPLFHADLHGPVTRVVYLTTNDPDERETEVTLTANVP